MRFKNRVKAVFKFLLLLVVLLLITEVILRLSGFQPGLFTEEIAPVDRLEIELVEKADSNGISIYIKGAKGIPAFYVVNEQGFLSGFDYTPAIIDSITKTRKKRPLMLVGDSYTEGCCVDSAGQSFAALLQADSNYFALNFGIGATGLLQYEAVIHKWLPIVKPGLIAVFYYTGNDQLMVEDTLHPFVPGTYRTLNSGWLSSSPGALAEYPGQYFENPQQAYEFNIRTYTLLGPNSSLFQKFFARSVVLSKSYIFIRNGWRAVLNLQHIHFGNQYTNERLLAIQRYCQSQGVKVVFVAIPTPSDIIHKRNLNKKYSPVFEGTTYYIPSEATFYAADFNGVNDWDHFNSKGHNKFYKYLKSVLEPEYQSYFILK